MPATPVATGPAERYESTASLRDAHATLLQDLPEEPTAKELERVADFIQKATATGAILDAPEDRRQAQGLIDYWSASLASNYRNTIAPSAPRGKPASPLLIPYNPGTITDTVQAADQWVKSLPEADREIVGRILLRLVRLPEGQRTFVTVPVARQTLTDIAPTEKIAPLIEKLANLKVIRMAPNGADLTLANESLSRQWPEYARWLDQRLRFRDTAKYWKQSAENPAALITGAPLDRARSYHDLDELERVFVEACRNRELRATRIYRTLTFVLAPVALIGLSLTGWFALREFDSQIRAAKSETDAARAAAETGIARAEKEKADALAAAAEQRRLDAEEETRRLSFALEKDVELRNEVAKLLQELLDEKIKSNFAPAVVKKYQDRLDALLPKKNGKSDSDPRLLQTRVRPVRPGVAIGAAGSKSLTGSVCCVVRDSSGQQFLLTSALIAGDEGTFVLQPPPLFDGTTLGALIGTVVPTRNPDEQMKQYKLGSSKVALIALAKGVEGTNSIPMVNGSPKSGKLTGVHTTPPAVGTSVFMVGCWSGFREGKVERVNRTGEVETTRMAEIRDIGAPVFTRDGKLVGMLVAGSSDELSVVMPLKQVFTELGVELVP